MFRSIPAMVLGFIVSFSVFGQTLPVDGNTVALWNFDTDLPSLVVDSSPNGLQGSALEAPLGPLPSSSAGLARYFKDQTSFLSFGPLLPGSPLDLRQYTEWTIEFTVRLDRSSTGIRNVFNNGIVSVEIHNGRLVANYKKFSHQFGIKTEFFLVPATTNRVMVVYKDDELAILVNNGVWASQYIGPNKELRSKDLGLPVFIGGVPRESVVTAAIGREHACLSGTAATSFCWGNNSHGQAGRGSAGDVSNLPLPVLGPPSFSMLSTGAKFSCGLNSTGLFCWGLNDELSLGVPGMYWSQVPVRVRDSADVSEIRSGDAHSCVLLNNKSLHCWGRNAEGQMGFGQFTQMGLSAPVVAMTSVEKFDLGANHGCAIDDGAVFCWGKNDSGQLGTAGGNSAVPLPVSGITTAVDIALGDRHSCALLSNNEVKCWGANETGQLGNGTFTPSVTPVSVSGISPSVPKAISSGLGNHSCVHLTTDRILCWGQNDKLQLGSTNPGVYLTAQDIGVGGVSKFIAGDKTNCLQRSNGLFCFGSNNFGALGTGSYFPPMSPTESSVFVFGQNFVPGWLDDIRVSNSARSPIVRPVLSSLNPTIVNSPNPTITFQVTTLYPLNAGSSTLKVNGVPSPGLNLSGNTLSGILQTALGIGKNILEVGIRDLAGNYGSLTIEMSFHPTLADSEPRVVRTSEINSCYLTEGGSVYCWGSNQFGQLGITSERFSSSPIKNPLLKNISQIALARGTLCALDRDGGVYCLGSNESGRLGINNYISEFSSPVPVKLTFAVPVTKLFGGENNFCALHSDNTLSCWGGNLNSNLGSASFILPSPTVVAWNLKSVALGHSHCCYLYLNGTLSCRGSNFYGELGSYGPEVELPQVPVEITASAYTSCAKTNNNRIYCWGQNQGGHFGPGQNPDGSFSPVLNTAITSAGDLHLGDGFACSRKNSILTCWGSNSRGELGTGNFQSNFSGYTQTQEFIDVSVFAGTVCGITSGRDVLCWGSNSIGQAGQPTAEPVLTPQAVVAHSGSLRVMSDIVAGEGNTCMKKGTQTFCWGNTSQGQLGQGLGTNYLETYPQKISIPANITQSSVGYSHICHLVGNSVYCAGRNDSGQIGTELTTLRVPRYTLVFSGATKVLAGESYTCALKSDLTVWCWGDNSQGSLGDGTFTNSSTPKQVLNLTDVQKLYVPVRGKHACALKTDGKVFCWGAFFDNKAPQTSAVEVPGLKNSVELALGRNFVCGLSAAGVGVCGVYNLFGAAGVGDLLPNEGYRPFQMNSPLKFIRAGENHVCGVDFANDLYCWGRNDQGQVGIGDVSASELVPLFVMSDVREVALGGSHTCAITNSNRLACWGFNGNGQLGNGSVTNAVSPTFSDVAK